MNIPLKQVKILTVLEFDLLPTFQTVVVHISKSSVGEFPDEGKEKLRVEMQQLRYVSVRIITFGSATVNQRVLV